MTGLFSPELFAGQVVLITNAGPWSAELADAFRRGGAAVATTHRSEKATVVLDTSDAAAVAEAFDAVEARFGQPSILINGPGERRELAAADTRLADWRRITEPNYDGVFLCCAEFARRRIGAEQRGWILNLIDTPDPVGHAAEVAAAAGVANLIKTLGAEWARDGLRVNGLASRGWARSPTPAASAQSLTAMALYLCSPYSGFVTASTLEIDAHD